MVNGLSKEASPQKFWDEALLLQYMMHETCSNQALHECGVGAPANTIVMGRKEPNLQQGHCQDLQFKIPPGEKKHTWRWQVHLISSSISSRQKEKRKKKSPKQDWRKMNVRAVKINNYSELIVIALYGLNIC